jgi:hypothetical protein
MELIDPPVFLDTLIKKNVVERVDCVNEVGIYGTIL